MLTLTVPQPTRVAVEAPELRPDRLATLSLAAVERLPLRCGNREAPLAELFSVTGDASDGHLHIVGDVPWLHYIGAGMQAGRITTTGSVGRHWGEAMCGGSLDIAGDAGDWLAAELHGGMVRVGGSVGDYVASARPGARRGMTGGVLLVNGNAGAGLAAGMRRGVIAVGGQVGDWAAQAMIAGTVCAFGAVGRYPCADMKRGTLACFGEAPELLPTFGRSCDYEPAFVALLLRQLRAWQFAPAATVADGRIRRYCGDSVALGLGEVLVRLPE